MRKRLCPFYRHLDLLAHPGLQTRGHEKSKPSLEPIRHWYLRHVFVHPLPRDGKHEWRFTILVLHDAQLPFKRVASQTQ